MNDYVCSISDFFLGFIAEDWNPLWCQITYKCWNGHRRCNSPTAPTQSTSTNASQTYIKITNPTNNCCKSSNGTTAITVTCKTITVTCKTCQSTNTLTSKVNLINLSNNIRFWITSTYSRNADWEKWKCTDLISTMSLFWLWDIKCCIWHCYKRSMYLPSVNFQSHMEEEICLENKSLLTILHTTEVAHTAPGSWWKKKTVGRLSLDDYFIQTEKRAITLSGKQNGRIYLKCSMYVLVMTAEITFGM